MPVSLRNGSEHDASSEEAEAYKATLMLDIHCSFCGRSMFQIDSLLEGHGGARICNLCVANFYEEISVNQPRG
jgi:hypothetical protein